MQNTQVAAFFQTFKFLRLFTKHMNAADFVCTLILHTKSGSFTFSDHSFLDLRCSVHVVRFYHQEEYVRDDLLDQQAFIFSCRLVQNASDGLLSDLRISAPFQLAHKNRQIF